jgi:sugar phosphate isomerase/epimerase
MKSVNRTFSLAHLTALALAPPALIRVAAQAGYTNVGLRLLPAVPDGPHHPLMNDAAMLKETHAVMKETGVSVSDLEIVRIDDSFNLARLKPFFETGAALGAKHILVAGDDGNPNRLVERFGALCEAAAQYKLTCDLEFMPWTQVKNAAAATRIVQAVAQPNAGVLFDAIHFFRSHSMLGDIAALPRAALHYAQVCDGKVPGPITNAGLIHDARNERLLPGEGAFGLGALLAALPDDLPISVEVPSATRASAMGYEAWASAALVATKKIIDAPKSSEFDDIKI